ncbi:hypothetical protein BKA82DRAFT_129079 [Pisolithus tinctorius]|uniref:C3H1-type domain-containing protein n=1 Tax=Pisolithus tinctorius Marx 270 TaxID=870435 RepID=A0A0C3JP35_PISTI|nr:hypothetical protein BKA82DRAFT_129079 [Pisolithus tinctorius]KIO10933.1 hypothetical protein M404DRAFT_129079 [Pisolithus tinctorius Marx 270]
MTSTSDAALKAEIARLTGAINHHKSVQQAYGPAPGPASYRRSNKYVNPTYRLPPSYKPQSYQNIASNHVPAPATKTTQPSSTRDVVIGGVAFESSSRSLVRKDAPKPTTAPIKVPLRPIPQQEFLRTTNGHRIPAGRIYKSKVSSRSHRLRNRNLTLDNTRPPTQGRRAAKRLKYVDKPCPRFTTTGACSRGLTCMYRHDPDKIAICWNFLHGNCPNTAESCSLSHDPIPERTPLCVHFANNGRCTREKCPFPHIRVGQRHGVCRDFAVLGFCAKGLDCEMQHVRECPDFAEKGTCSTKGCKLPHVIRANRSRKVHSTSAATPTTPAPSAPGLKPLADSAATSAVTSSSLPGPENTPSSQHVSVKDAQLGDDFVSLVFNESEDDDDDDDDNNDDTDEEDDTEDEESEKEGSGPTPL